MNQVTTTIAYAGFSWLIPQNSASLPPNGLASDRRLTDAECDKRLAGIFGGPGAVVGSTRDPITLEKFANNLAYYQNAGLPIPPNFGERAPGHGPAPTSPPPGFPEDAGGIIHIYGNAQGTAANTGLYAPGGGTVGHIYTTKKGNAQLGVSYSTGLSITFVHLTGASGGPNDMGSVRIGNISGPGGQTPGYFHTHIVFFNRGKRVDPRKVFCGQ